MAKGAVCKTVSCGFNSHPRLQFRISAVVMCLPASLPFLLARPVFETFRQGMSGFLPQPRNTFFHPHTFKNRMLTNFSFRLCFLNLNSARNRIILKTGCIERCADSVFLEIQDWVHIPNEGNHADRIFGVVRNSRLEEEGVVLFRFRQVTETFCRIPQVNGKFAYAVWNGAHRRALFRVYRSVFIWKDGKE